MNALTAKITTLSIVALLLVSCGNMNNFRKPGFRKIRKVRVDRAQETEVDRSIASYDVPSESIPVDKIVVQEHPSIDSDVLPETVVFEEDDAEVVYEPKEEKVIDVAPAKTEKSSARKEFDINHFVTLGAYAAGFGFAAAGYIAFSVLWYAIAAIFLVTALIMAAVMKYRIAPRVSERDKTYKRRLWFANLVFYSLMLVNVLVFVAIGVISAS